MIFGPVPLDQAQGAILAHSIALPQGRLRKGQRLDAAALRALGEAGFDQVTAARLAPDDVAEDAAATRLAAALAPDPEALGLRLGSAATGRVNVTAAGAGVMRIDPAIVAAVNGVHPMITLATLPEWQRVIAGTMAATIKIISYAVPGAALDRACAVAAGGALRLCPPVIARAAYVETLVEGQDTLSTKGEAAIRTRLDRLGVAMTTPQRIRHRRADLARAIAEAEGEAVLILTGSATSDPDDLAPAALRDAGGEVIHFGMPVDPGNLLFFGSHAGRPVIGLPGCARSPALNGADWVLERLLCGVPVTPQGIAAMGVGGLLKEIPTRPRPREG
ncbi:molybdopterin-binding protein [Pseudooceanicola aestuarii]|uniref:molybdopterin-binding protein n=1 Tax=Pseudooceanicola aestuarii TaxID=2697319 RepID=UPI0013D5D1F6|nr:molybdopterin-binding protein [Pseudooceanicola aestuarii]